MHEVGIMQEAARVAVETARRSGAERVKGLNLRVGALSGVAPEALHFAFEVASQNPVLQGAWLRVETVPASGWCSVCHTEFECADWVAQCPNCGQVSDELQHGREVEIASVEIC